MKPAWLFLTATGSVLSACLVNGDISIKPNTRTTLREFPLSLDVSNAPSLSRPPGLPNLPPNLTATGQSQTLSRPSPRFFSRPPNGLATNDNEPVKPGIYLAKPFTMMVLVPGEHATGDAMKDTLNRYPGTNTMPIIRPEVHLEPLPDHSNSK